jgi:uncharacterized protein YjbI with pentapeptide repeats
MIDILNRYTKAVLYHSDTADTIAAAVVEAAASGADLRGADLRGADLRGADLRGADLRGADLRGADLRGADLRGAGVIRIISNYEVTLYPGKNGPELAYGCERHPLADWPALVDKLCMKHNRPDVADEIRAIIELCKTVKQPVFEDAR